MLFEGACHCGAVRTSFATSRAREDIQVRACQCSFCRRRGGKTVSDPDGRLTFRAKPGKLRRYRFGTSGDIRVLADRPGEPMDYDAETVEGRTARRRRNWSPAAVVEAP